MYEKFLLKVIKPTFYINYSFLKPHPHTTPTVEIATLTRVAVEEGGDRTQIRVLPSSETDTIIKEFYVTEEAKKKQLEKEKQERARQEKAAASSKDT